MADVYILASPTPVLYAYPSALHAGGPTPPPSEPNSPFYFNGKWFTTEPNQPMYRDDDEIALFVLGVI